MSKKVKLHKKIKVILFPSRLQRATFLKEEGFKGSLFEGAVTEGDWGSLYIMTNNLKFAHL